MTDPATGIVLIVLLLVVVGYLVWVEILDRREMRARHRATGQAWQAYCDMNIEWMGRLSDGQAPGPIPQWKEFKEHQ